MDQYSKIINQLRPKTLYYIELFGHKQRMRDRLNISEEEYILLEKGECNDLTVYVRCLTYFLREIVPKKIELKCVPPELPSKKTILGKIVPKKIELKCIPPELPSKKTILGMMCGEIQYTELYTQIIDTLLSMPDLPPQEKLKCTPVKNNKKKKARHKRRKASRPYGIHSQITWKEWGSPDHPARI